MDDLDADLLVVGGGIHGVGVAQASAAAGFRTLLIEQTSLAFGTSSRSSKLIHGGLRYLEGGHIRLVRESLTERELLIKLAPTLVKRQPFLIPIYRTTTRGPWMIRAGLTLYAVLAGGRKEVRYRSIPKREWSQLDGLKTESIRKVFQYWDAQTDDRLLTEAVMRSAESLGAKHLCPARFIGASLKENHCEVEIEHEGASRILRVATLVNAAGPWANQILSCIRPHQEPMIVELVQGTHLELPGKVSKGCYYLEVPEDKRAVFVLPWKDRTLLGTTERKFEGDPANVMPHEDEVEYLLKAYKEFFPNRDQTVLDKWAGLRVLPSGEGPAFNASRETQLPVDRESKPRLLSIFGGKLTAYRATAERVVSRLRESMPDRQEKARTDQLHLS